MAATKLLVYIYFVKILYIGWIKKSGGFILDDKIAIVLNSRKTFVLHNLSLGICTVCTQNVLKTSFFAVQYTKTCFISSSKISMSEKMKQQSLEVRGRAVGMIEADMRQRYVAKDLEVP